MNNLFPFCSPVEKILCGTCRTLWDDLYVITPENRILCARPSRKNTPRPEQLSEILDDDEIAALHREGAPVKTVGIKSRRMLLLYNLQLATGLSLLFLLGKNADSVYIDELIRLANPPALPRQASPRIVADCLRERIVSLAQMVGCKLAVEMPDALWLGENSVFSLPCLDAFLIVLFCHVHQKEPDQFAHLCLSNEDGRLHLRTRLTSPFSRKISEFFRALAGAQGFAFSPIEQPGSTALYFSPDRPDPSLLGLKNNFRFH